MPEVNWYSVLLVSASLIWVAAFFVISIPYDWFYVHNHSTEYTYNAATVSNGLIIYCNTTIQSQMCVYNYNNIIHYCSQNLTANCTPYNSVCSVIVNANNGYCNNYTEYPNEVVSPLQLNGVGIFVVVLCCIIIFTPLGLAVYINIFSK